MWWQYITGTGIMFACIALAGHPGIFGIWIKPKREEEDYFIMPHEHKLFRQRDMGEPWSADNTPVRHEFGTITFEDKWLPPWKRYKTEF